MMRGRRAMWNGRVCAAVSVMVLLLLTVWGGVYGQGYTGNGGDPETPGEPISTPSPSQPDSAVQYFSAAQQADLSSRLSLELRAQRR